MGVVVLCPPPHGKALVVHNFNAVAGLSRQVGLFRGRARVEGVLLVCRSSSSGLVCGGLSKQRPPLPQRRRRPPRH